MGRMAPKNHLSLVPKVAYFGMAKAAPNGITVRIKGRQLPKPVTVPKFALS